MSGGKKIPEKITFTEEDVADAAADEASRDLPPLAPKEDFVEELAFLLKRLHREKFTIPEADQIERIWFHHMSRLLPKVELPSPFSEVHFAELQRRSFLMQETLQRVKSTADRDSEAALMWMTSYVADLLEYLSDYKPRKKQDQPKKRGRPKGSGAPKNLVGGISFCLQLDPLALPKEQARELTRDWVNKHGQNLHAASVKRYERDVRKGLKKSWKTNGKPVLYPPSVREK